MKDFLLRIPAYSVTLIVALAIIYLTLVPSPLPGDMPRLFPHADKLIHALMFWAFYTSFAFDRARWQLGEKLSWRLDHTWCAVIMISTLVFGAAIEVGQSALGMGRTADLLDFAADATGAIIASRTYKPINRYLLR